MKSRVKDEANWNFKWRDKSNSIASLKAQTRKYEENIQHLAIYIVPSRC